MGSSRRRYEFGGYTLDHRNWALFGPNGARLDVTPKAFDALVLFLEHPGEVIDGETLIAALWPDTIVEENNLRQVIAALRRVLGDDCIRTVPRRGYQFTADVRVVPDVRLPEPASAAASTAHGRTARGRLRRTLTRPAALIAILVVAAASAALWYTQTGTLEPTRLAVLPFADASPDGDLEYVADGISLELLTTLSLIDGLDVTGSTSSFYFRDHPADPATIGDRLGVDYILEGDVRSADERLRIAVRLTNADSGSQIWSQSYDRLTDDLFVLQDEIARTTAQALEITLGVGDLGTRPGTTRNPEAFFAFVQAQRTLRQGIGFAPEDIRKAIPYLERAVSIDPDFAIGWFELYWRSRSLHIFASETGRSAPGALERAEYALRRVEELTPDLPELVLSKLETSANADDIAHALERLIDTATKTRYPTWILAGMEATYLRYTGRLREAATAAERARAFDPLNQAPVGLLADAYAAEGRQREALDLIDEFTEIRGTTPGIEGTAFVIALGLGDPEEVARRAAAMLDSRNAITRDLVRNIDDPEVGLSMLRKFVAAPDQTMLLWPTLLAPWAAYFGDDELALEMYRHEVPYAAGNTISKPIFAGMRRLPGFRDLVRDLGFFSYWRESGNWPDYCRPLEREEFECF